MTTRLTVFIFGVVGCCVAAAQEPTLEELEQRCEAAREQMLAPLREEAIAECIETKSRTSDVEAYCQRFYADFGAERRTESGGVTPRMFHDLPECLEYEQVRRGR